MRHQNRHWKHKGWIDRKKAAVTRASTGSALAHAHVVSHSEATLSYTCVN